MESRSRILCRLLFLAYQRRKQAKSRQITKEQNYGRIYAYSRGDN